ncbi:MAG TPA: RNA 2',3'-cyclic phosphodiesterase [Bacillota bacterium]|nr:RNA 2',3'-cyclic phosphodiesterase [Bacillota bacterium]HUM56523.1 RNA 2',3'-cyclic phosphodiesterase [Bacillota bacterium]
MRTFIAVTFDEGIKKDIEEIIIRIKRVSERGRFSPGRNLHLTLFFLGDTDIKKIDDIKNAMDMVKCEKFDLKLLSPGRFSKGSSDIYWLGTEESIPLLRLQNDLSRELMKIGFSAESKRFTPHLTIARQVKGDFKKACEAAGVKKTMIQKVDGISLMESRRINGKQEYTEMYRKNF